MTRAFRIGVVLCGIGIPHVANAQVTLPHTFTPNTPARASEVNENFTAVKDAVDDTVERVDAAETQLATLAQTPLGGLKVRVDDVLVGTLFTIDNTLGGLSSLLALNERGTFVSLNYSNPDETPGASSALQTASSYYFDQPGCQGNVHVSGVGSFQQKSMIFRQGIVFATGPGDAVTARYSKGDPALLTVQSQQFYDFMNRNWICHDANPTFDLEATPAVPNDPAVTGVSSDLSGPVRVSLD